MVRGYCVATLLIASSLLCAQTPQPSTAEVMERMLAGRPVLIQLWGASTYLGLSPMTGQPVPDPPPAVIKRVLTAYYLNNNIRVQNASMSGTGTSAMVKTWADHMQRSAADLIFIGYGINDVIGQPQNPMIPVAEYIANLESMISMAQETGKAVVLDTPHSMPEWRPGISEQMKIFSEAARSVAMRRGIPVVDSFSWSEQAYSVHPNMAENLSDGVHLSAELLRGKAYLMAGALMQPLPVLGPRFIPANTAQVRASVPYKLPQTNAVPASVGSRGNAGTCAETYTVAVHLASPGLDLYWGASTWTQGPDNVEVRVDDSVVGSLSLRYGMEGVALDQEILVAEAPDPGVHVITLQAPAGSCVPVNYLRTRWTRKQGTSMQGSSYTQIVGEQFLFSAEAPDFQVVSDTAVSRFVRPAQVYVEADFSPGQGFILFAHPTAMLSSVLPARGGLYIYQDDHRHLAIKEWLGGAFSAPYVLNNEATLSGRHAYAVTVNIDGTARITVDRQDVGLYRMSGPWFGGFIGFFSEQPGLLEIDKVAVN